MLYEPSQNTIYSGYMSDSHTSRTGHLSKSLSKYRYAPQVKYEEGVQCDKSMSNSNKSMGQKIFNKLFQTKDIHKYKNTDEPCFKHNTKTAKI